MVTSVGSEIVRMIVKEYLTNINKKGYLLQDYLSLLQEVIKDNYGSGISFKKINEVISKNNYGSITINAFIRNNLIIFNFLHERCVSIPDLMTPLSGKMETAFPVSREP